MNEFKEILAEEILNYGIKIGMGEMTKEEAMEYIEEDAKEMMQLVFTSAKKWHNLLISKNIITDDDYLRNKN